MDEPHRPAPCRAVLVSGTEVTPPLTVNAPLIVVWNWLEELRQKVESE